MKYILLITIIIILSKYSLTNAQWLKTNTPFNGPAWSIWASDSSLIAGTGYGIYNSLDMGNTWSETLSGTKLEFVQTFVTTPAKSIGTNLFAGGLGGVYLSTNGGASWIAANKGLENKEVHSLAVSSDGTGGTTTLFAGTTSGVFRSTDNGTNWVASGLDSNVFALTAIKDEAGKSIILAGIEGSDIFRSTDNGSSWTAIPLRTNWTFCFATSSNGAGGTNIFAGTYSGVYQSTDNGINWTYLNAGPHWSVHSLAIIPNGAGGMNFFAGTFMGGVFLSTNNGSSWHEANTGLSYENEAINALVILRNYICAFTSNISGGVWKRPLSETIASVTSVNNSGNGPSNFNLEQNYPNPFNPTTKIKYSVPQSSYALLKVFDVLGREIATLVNEKKSAGSYEVEFNASNLSSGTYFYQLKAGSFMETKKMVLIR